MSIETPQETPQRPEVSPETRDLIELCTAVARGDQEPLPRLEARLQERQKGLSAAWENFAKNIEAESEAVTEPRKPIIEAVEGQYQAYSNALDKVARFLTSRQAELLDEAATALAEAGPALRAAIITYDMSILLAGNSRFPDVNLFENLSKRLKAGHLPVAVWRATCQGHQEFYSVLIKEIDDSSAPNEPGIPERRAAATAIVGCLKRFEDLKPDSPQTDFEAIHNLLATAHIDMEAAINTYNYHTLSETPTASPEANRVIHAAQWVIDGRGPRELMQGEAAYYQERVRRSITDLKVAARLPAESTVIAEEAPKMLTAMEAMDEALEELKATAESPADIEAAVSQFKTACDELNQSLLIVQQQNENFGKAQCPNCQAFNVATAKMCEKCQRRLPEFASQASTDAAVPMGRDMVPTRTMLELQEACLSYEKGALTQEEFVSHLRIQEEKVRQAEMKLARLKLPDMATFEAKDRELAQTLMHYTTDGMSLLAQGVGLCMSGLMRLEQYANEDQASDMREGLREFFEGCQKLLQIEQVAKDMVASLPSEFIEGGTTASDEDAPPDQGNKAEEVASPVEHTHAAPVDEVSSFQDDDG